MRDGFYHLLPQQWIFGGVCRERYVCFLVEVPNQFANTLLKEIKENVEKESMNYSDSWKSYCSSKLEEASFEHFNVNYKYNFVDPETGTHVQNIERHGAALNGKIRNTEEWNAIISKVILQNLLWKRQTEDPFEKKSYVKMFMPPKKKLF